MLSVPKQPRRLSITAAQIGDAAPPLDQLVRWSASIQLGKRPKFKEWVLDGQPTGNYACAKPTYKFSPNFGDARLSRSRRTTRDCRSVDIDTSILLAHHFVAIEINPFR